MLRTLGSVVVLQRRYNRNVLLGSSIAIGSFGAVNWRYQCIDQKLSDVTSVVIPTFEASLRAARLVRTVFMMVMDYQTAKYKPTMNSGNEDKIEELQREIEWREKELESAQIEYTSKPNDSDLTKSQYNALKRDQKQRMQEAASNLAETEKKLENVEGESSKSRLHRRAANRLLELCRRNGGVYIKVGQHLANLDYLIPSEYIEVLSSLFDEAPQSSYEDVRRVIEESLNGNIEEIFDNFHPTPIASASLAQVHIAYDKSTGRKLAVKVQHRGLRETCVGDILAVTAIVRLLDFCFDDFTFAWIADEIAPHLPRELDFTIEGRNSERAAAHMAKSGLPCVVPKVLWSTTASRVLTMEFEEGFKATDKSSIAQSGLKEQ